MGFLPLLQNSDLGLNTRSGLRSAFGPLQTGGGRWDVVFQPGHAAIQALGSLHSQGKAQLGPPHAMTPGGQSCHLAGYLKPLQERPGPTAACTIPSSCCRCSAYREAVSEPKAQAEERQHHVAFASTQGQCQEADAAPSIHCETSNLHPHGDSHVPVPMATTLSPLPSFPMGALPPMPQPTRESRTHFQANCRKAAHSQRSPQTENRDNNKPEAQTSFTVVSSTLEGSKLDPTQSAACSPSSSMQLNLLA